MVIKLQVLDVSQRIGAVGAAGTQIDNLPATIRVLRYLIISRRPGIDRRIATAATINSVIAGPARERVVEGAARERVVEGAAEDVLDTAENVTLCIAARAEAGEEVHAHCGGGRGVVRRIHSRAADQRVGARAALERVVSRPTEQHVVSAQPTKNVRLIGRRHHRRQLEDLTAKVDEIEISASIFAKDDGLFTAPMSGMI